ncbi:hypothetical protein HPC49_19625 [Pyxidicoccus fallax]|uniref:Uncharacterized protein n=1 Tax=Pyxidicoccus fallax TaxID=394095 RepID=A0A848LEL7_9BACT|nr:hypothetical protein [Pyxidicoccus fallax]NMO16916.1 hypothetical protein [Pyxidicoccus fallax]NPC80423.1 hypothetical protein [Pyxidicoccus fallax]
MSRQDARALVNAYAAALLARDVLTVEAILSKDSLERIQEAGKQRGIAEPLAFFIERERRNLVEALGGAERLHTGFDVGTVEQREGTPVTAAALHLNGKALEKSLRMTQEAGALKVVVGRDEEGTAQLAASSSDYRVVNYVFAEMHFECAEGRQYSVPAYGLKPPECRPDIGCIPGGMGPGTKMASCVDYGCGFLNSGSYFTYAGQSYFCDYNTWGEDFIILSQEHAQCHDEC